MASPNPGLYTLPPPKDKTVKQFIVTWADDADENDIYWMAEAIDQCDGDFDFQIVNK